MEGRSPLSPGPAAPGSSLLLSLPAALTFPARTPGTQRILYPPLCQAILFSLKLISEHLEHCRHSELFKLKRQEYEDHLCTHPRPPTIINTLPSSFENICNIAFPSFFNENTFSAMPLKYAQASTLQRGFYSSRTLLFIPAWHVIPSSTPAALRSWSYRWAALYLGTVSPVQGFLRTVSSAVLSVCRPAVT